MCSLGESSRCRQNFSIRDTRCFPSAKVINLRKILPHRFKAGGVAKNRNCFSGSGVLIAVRQRQQNLKGRTHLEYYHWLHLSQQLFLITICSEVEKNIIYQLDELFPFVCLYHAMYMTHFLCVMNVCIVSDRKRSAKTNHSKSLQSQCCRQVRAKFRGQASSCARQAVVDAATQSHDHVLI